MSTVASVSPVMRAGWRPGSAKPKDAASNTSAPRALSLRRLYPARSLAALAFAALVLLTAHTGRTVHRTPNVPADILRKAPPVKVSLPVTRPPRACPHVKQLHLLTTST
jgi:hypothetical protein